MPVVYRHLESLGFPGYRVGADGSVWTCKNARHGFRDWWKRLKPGLQGTKGKQYLHVGLTTADGRRRSITVHRLVALAFHGPCPDGQECRHLNGDKLDNTKDNLAWGTQLQNREDALRHGTPKDPPIKVGVENASAKLTEEQVREAFVMIVAGRNLEDIARHFSVSTCPISGIKRGILWRHLFSPEELQLMASLVKRRKRRSLCSS